MVLRFRRPCFRSSAGAGRQHNDCLYHFISRSARHHSGILAPAIARRERVVIEGSAIRVLRICTTAAELARCKPIWPIVAISLMASTASGIGGPILYYLRDTVHLTTCRSWMFSSIQWLAMIPGALAHAALCKRYPLGKLLMASVLIALPQLLTLLLLDSSRRLIPVT